jgi:hypothetical protein
MHDFGAIDRIFGFVFVFVLGISSIVRWRNGRTVAALLMLIGSLLLFARTLGFEIAYGFSSHTYSLLDFCLLWVFPPLGALFFCAGYAIDSFKKQTHCNLMPNQSSDPTLSSGTPRAGHEPRHR